MLLQQTYFARHPLLRHGKHCNIPYRVILEVSEELAQNRLQKTSKRQSMHTVVYLSFLDYQILYLKPLQRGSIYCRQKIFGYSGGSAGQQFS